eukprot:TRINITY_DN15517_c0_g1_i1.p1 TRINITY_DN15517_c0_g1~~TRINITY_DN15517_c0_g1_i1.p1  ORF type:complete len:796 (+),score=127.88 TRINITY_DN15517_c0_g1_i1:90-2477(+)
MNPGPLPRAGGATPASPARMGTTPFSTTRSMAVVQAHHQASGHQMSQGQQQMQGAVLGQSHPQLQRQVMNWIQQKPRPSFAADSLPVPVQSGKVPASQNGIASNYSYNALNAHPKVALGHDMSSASVAATSVAGASAAAPAGSGSRQARPNDRPGLQMTVPQQGSGNSSSSRTGISATIMSPRRTGSPTKHSADSQSLPSAQQLQQQPREQQIQQQQPSVSRTNRMRSLDTGPPTGRAVVLTQQDQPGGGVNSFSGPHPHRSGLAAKATACAGGARNGAYRSTSTLEPSPRRFRGEGTCHRALSAGVRLGEGPSLSRGATASSSSALPISSASDAACSDATGIIRRSSVGCSLARQRSGRRHGSPSPPRGGECGSVRPSAQGPPSSRGTPGRKTAVSVAVTGATGSMVGGGLGTEPEAEPANNVSHSLLPQALGPKALAAAAAAAAAHVTNAYHPAAASMAAVTSASTTPSMSALGGLSEEHGGTEEAHQNEIFLSFSRDRLNVRVTLYPSEKIALRDVQMVQPINRGTYGEVHLARYNGEEVSVKRCILNNDGSMTKEQMHNLEREIRAYKTLDHPNIVKFIGCVVEHPFLAIVTEYLPNGNLFDLLFMRRVNLNASVRLNIARQVCLALTYMHSCDPAIIHRDLKTQNLVLDANYNVKLCDFGKTQAMVGDKPLPHDSAASPRYQAPECFAEHAYITEKVDIWSLGCCLIEVLGGPLPYEEIPSMDDVQRLLLHEKIPPLVPPWFTPQIQPMLKKCFDFDPTKRIGIGQVLLELKSLTAEDLERHGMDKRRVR